MPDEPPRLTGYKAVVEAILDRVPPAVMIALAIIGGLAWAGPNFRSALHGVLPIWLRVWLPRLYLTAVVLAFILLLVVLLHPWWSARGARLSRKQLDELRGVTKLLAECVEAASELVQQVFASEPANRVQVAGVALSGLAELSCRLFMPTQGANRALLFVPSPDGHSLVPHPSAHSGFADDELSLIRLPLEEPSVAGYVYISGKPYIAAPAAGDPIFYKLEGVAVPGAVLCVPVKRTSAGGTEEVAAVLSVDSSRDKGFIDLNAWQLQVLASSFSDVLTTLQQAGGNPI